MTGSPSWGHTPCCAHPPPAIVTDACQHTVPHCREDTHAHTQAHTCTHGAGSSRPLSALLLQALCHAAESRRCSGKGPGYQLPTPEGGSNPSRVQVREGGRGWGGAGKAAQMLTWRGPGRREEARSRQERELDGLPETQTQRGDKEPPEMDPHAPRKQRGRECFRDISNAPQTPRKVGEAPPDLATWLLASFRRFSGAQS